ncbi:hypothetical protein COJ50_04935 [Bacillus cereus]|uniref:Uncharacterized protein n=1 Tax=Bacillus cereus TaxID=1396 RepID=A0A2A8R454_BACCE|nr:hypothetical protein CN450_22335 [Bacillus cereus]PFN28585.1 hypothetical protein COJ50_04935 [Bacillus cereus]
MIRIIPFIYIFHKIIVCNSLWDLYKRNDKNNFLDKERRKAFTKNILKRNKKTSEKLSEVFSFLSMLLKTQ